MPTRASRRVHAPLHEPTAAVKSMIIANFSFGFRDNYFSSGRVVGNPEATKKRGSRRSEHE